eukprot:TRINITY_DN1888_c0_g1_i3.p1 TRINITY_DN1888_c0_g1~~TRINITY_DN1888_c0_g1_i3.p1  ORF type:complete len:417 (+),score=62.78 TRINITY_DN1888_c0_g1_i3:120-1253(+)
MSRIRGFEICMKIQPDDSYLEKSFMSKYPIWSIAGAPQGENLQILSGSTFSDPSDETNSSVCIAVSHDVLTFETNGLTFFLARISENWSEEDQLNSSEYIMLILASCIFWAFCLTSIFVTLSCVSFWGPIYAKGDYLIFMGSAELIVFALFRGLLFSLLASSTNMNSVGQNILIEFPTFLYLSLVMEQIASFRPETAAQLKRIFSFGIHVFLAVLFAIVIILLNSVDNSPSEVTCRGRVVQSGDSLSNTDKLRIIYKTIVGFISLFASIFLAHSGFKAVSQMRDFRIKNQQVLQGLEAYELPVLAKTLVISMSLSLNCLGFIIYYSLDSPTPYFIFFLFGTEVLPLVSLQFIFRREVSLKFGTSKHGTSTGPSTVDL